jgi:hypothetical protein
MLFPHRLHLVWDLDATLIDTTYEDAPSADVSFASSSGGGKHYSVHFRPYAQSVLVLLRRSNDMYMFTAATPGYTDRILAKLVPPGFFLEVLYRDALTKFPPRPHHRHTHRAHQFSKDLTRVAGGSLDLSRAVLIDDKATNQVDGQHIIVVRPYDVKAEGASRDAEMLRVLAIVTLFNLTGDNALTRALLEEASHPPSKVH